MASVVIEDVSHAPRDNKRLWGGYLDRPQVGSQSNGHAVEIVGWVLPRSGPAVAVEVVHAGTVIQRVPLNMRRPDLAKGFSQVPYAEQGGFRISVTLPGTDAHDIEVQAVLPDQQRVPIGTVRARRQWHERDDAAARPLVSVVIPCYNQAHFLPEAIDSVLAQTYPHFEIIVVDDGATDNTAAVAARYPGVRYVRQANAGLSAARNTGIRHSSGSYLVFLDADDRLLPHALEAGITCFATRPECAFVAGHYRLINRDGSILEELQQQRVAGDHYLALLERNFIAMHATVMYQRIVFESGLRFDPTLKACEDYDLYLRIARDNPICCHDHVIAEYRQHGTNMTRNLSLMLASAITVLQRQIDYVNSREGQYKEAYETGIRVMGSYYGTQLVTEIQGQLWSHEWQQAVRGLRTLSRYYPQGLASLSPLRFNKRRKRTASITSTAPDVEQQPPTIQATSVPRPTQRQLHEQIFFGNLRRTTPVSQAFGFDRGQPIDRYYIERFLERYSNTIHGRVLEIGDNSYTRQFGGTRVTQSDVLHVVEGNPLATFVGDLTCADHIPSDAFDCVILTQTLHLIYDIRKAIQTAYRILKPGGALLATVPGISQLSTDEWRESWFWSFTTFSIQRLFEEVFSPAQITIDAHGNVLASIAFLQGLAVDELHTEELNYHDPNYQLLITIKAIKPAHNEVASSQQSNGEGEHPFHQTHLHSSSLPAAKEQRAVILMYHRVAELGSDPWALSVTPTHFAEHLAVLRQSFHPIGLRRMRQALLENDLPPRSVVVTFDDGYLDNLHHARPALERHDTEATVFVTSGTLGQRREFWWDELDRLLLQPGSLPETLQLCINGTSYEWELGAAASYSPAAYQSYRAWRAWEDAPTMRHTLYRSLWELLQPLPSNERRTVLDALRAWAGAAPAGRPSHRTLSAEEVVRLAQGGLIEIGAHTVSHPLLASLPPAAQRDEIQNSKVWIEGILGAQVSSFAYPHGGRADYSAATIALTQEAGFVCACSSIPGIVGYATDHFQLPRLHIPDWDGDEFARQLSGWFAT